MFQKVIFLLTFEKLIVLIYVDAKDAFFIGGESGDTLTPAEEP